MPTQISPRVAALLEKTRAPRGRLIFTIDATRSREPNWDIASSLQTAMFEEAAKIGGLEVQLVYFRGSDECSSTSWTTDTSELAKQMRMIRCEAGATQIRRALKRIAEENARKKVDAAIFIGDAVEEVPQKLYDAAAGLPRKAATANGGTPSGRPVLPPSRIVASKSGEMDDEVPF